VALEPESGHLLTTLAPIFVDGHAYDAEGLEMLFVKVNDRSAFFKSWQDGETESPWRFNWTPPGEGVYRFTPLLTEHEGEVPLQVTENDRMQGQSSTEEGKPLDNHAELANDIFLPFVQFYIMPTEVFTGTSTTLYVDLTPPTVDIDPTVLTSEQTLGHRVVELAGSVYDATQVHTVQVRIDDGPWDLAGIDEDGRWRYPWALTTQANGERYAVSVRADDVAGRIAEVTEDVYVDIAAPVPGSVSYAYVNTSGETIPMAPGDWLIDAVSLVVTWTEAPESDGDVHYQVGFSSQPIAQPEELTEYDAAGSHSQAVAAGERRYAIVRYVDEQGNTTTVENGPFYTTNEH
jgi:hypothetical protein